jgi:hypothetical protein
MRDTLRSKETAMGWNAKRGREQDALVGIVSTLLALADLVERAACRSPWVRWCVLWSAWRADLVARDYVAGSARSAAGAYWSPALASARYGAAPADAFDLAQSLRALALILRDMAEQIERLVFLQGRAVFAADSDLAGRHNARLTPAAMFSPPRWRDTS